MLTRIAPALSLCALVLVLYSPHLSAQASQLTARASERLLGLLRRSETRRGGGADERARGHVELALDSRADLGEGRAR